MAAARRYGQGLIGADRSASSAGVGGGAWDKLHAPVVERKPGVPDIPESYARQLAEEIHKVLGCAVRLTSGMTHANGKHTKGVLEIDFFDNDDLDRVIRMIGVEID